MKHGFIALALLLTDGMAASTAQNRVFSDADVDRLNAERNLDLKDAEGRTELVPGMTIPFKLEFTNKGNGCLIIGGLGIRFFDQHRDMITFAGGSLAHRLVDVNGDGYKDLLFEGTVENWGEKGEAMGKRPLTAIFRFDPSTKRFINTTPDPALYVYQVAIAK